MNKLTIPPSASWYKNQICVCAPDNTFIYAAKGDIVTVQDTENDEPPKIRIIPNAHVIFIASVDINRKWGAPNKFVVSTDTNTISLWNMEKYELKDSHKCEKNKNLVGAIFGGDDRVVSVTQEGVIDVWNIHTNEFHTFTILSKLKGVNVTCLSSCPHSGWLIAFGLASGLVVVTDLRRGGKILFKLQGHTKSIVSLAWCPAPVNVFPVGPKNTVKNKTKEDSQEKSLIIKEEKTEINDFLKECEALKNKILGIESKEENLKTEKPDLREKHFVDSPEKEKERRLEDEIQEGRQLPTHYDPSSDDLFSYDENKENKAIESENKENKAIESENKENEGIESEKENKGSESEIKEENPIDIGKGIVEEIVEKVIEQHRTIEIVPIEEEPRREFLLASSGRDRVINIWRGGTDGRLQTSSILPKKSKKLTQNQNENQNVWVTLCWITPDQLISTSGSHEYIIWKYPKPKNLKEICRQVKNSRHRQIFNIAAPIYYPTEYNWKNEQKNLKIWILDQNGLITNEDLFNNIFLCYPTIGSIITSVSGSPLDPNRLALGFKDGNVKMWDLSQPHKKEINFITFRRFQTKITTLSWHPINENCLAFGNEEGRVGVINLQTGKIKLLQYYFYNPIYNLEWGPLNGNINNLGLYVNAEGKVAIYDVKDDSEPKLLPVPNNGYIFKISWKPDFNVLLLNTKDGALIVYSKELEMQTVAYLSEKSFYHIIWHPDAKNNDPEKFPYCNWFAAATSKEFFTYNCSLLQSDEKYTALNTFSQSILALAWSPFDGNKLVTSIEDGLVHVWDIEKKEIISSYIDPYEYRYSTLIWSPVDPDLIIMCGKILTIWKISEYPPLKHLEPPKKIKKSTAKTSNKKSVTKDSILSSIYSSSNENYDLQIDNMKKLKNSIFDNETLKIFGDKENSLEILNEIQTKNKIDRKFNFYNLASLWKGDLGTVIREAIQENRVTPMLLILAPMVSPKLWQEACESYAKKQSEDPEADPLETAGYLIACHKIREAIDHLIATFHYKEALALAKCRLSDDNEVIKKITLEWARSCIHQGNFEIAALCLISINDLDKAAHVLAKRNNEKALEFAAELAEDAHNEELKKSIVFKMAKLKESPNILNAENSEDDEILENKEERRTSLIPTVGVVSLQVGLNQFGKTEKLLTRAEAFLKRGKTEENIEEEVD